MITGCHTILFADDAEAARAFFRDVLSLPCIDVHDGWLIFQLPQAEMGVHQEQSLDDASNTPRVSHHELYFICDDLEETVEDFKERGVQFLSDVEEARFGKVISFQVPGAGSMSLYQPAHPTAYER